MKQSRTAPRTSRPRSEGPTRAKAAETLPTAQRAKSDPDGARPVGAALPKTAKGRRRKEAFLSATARALNRHGYRDLNIADIAEEANAPVGLFYRYFPGKAEAVLEALDEIVDKFRKTLPSGDRTFFEHQEAAHRNLIRLYSEAPGLLGCYFSFDYTEVAFARFFHDQTLRFDLEHAQRALRELRHPKLAPKDLIVLAHALTAMTDNFGFRFCTGRDETAALEKAARIDVATLLAQIRTRAFVLSDNGAGSMFAGLISRRGEGPSVELRASSEIVGIDSVSKRVPKRADSTASFLAMKAAALRLLNRLSYDEMRISDIEAEGNLTRGAIYHYFGEKRELVLALLRDRLSDLHTRLQNSASAPASHPFDALRKVLEPFILEYSANPGILRAIYQLEESEPGAADFVGGYRRLWARHLGAVVSAQIGASPKLRSALTIVGYAMLAMVERVCYDLYVFPFDEFRSRVADDQVTDILASIWSRALFAENPPERVLSKHTIFRAMIAPRS